MTLLEHARALLADPDLDCLADARIGAPLGNSIAGSILSIITKSPRWATEQAVMQALAELDATSSPDRGA
ncbi:MAG: hypothetical protein C5B60_01810 [Chloroflexi bacterium]|nr:MAG: hypothetical protein C5B60_01810 [Chloroflexota bacterium]